VGAVGYYQNRLKHQDSEMPEFLWDTWEFWEKKRSLLRKAGRRWGRQDFHEAIGAVWIALRDEFPAEVSEGIDPGEGLINKIIYRRALDHFRREAGRRFLPIDAVGDALLDDLSPDEDVIARETSHDIDAVLQSLAPAERELVKTRYGFAGEEVSTSVIAKGRGVSRQ